jgi:hypothetical protein
MDDMRNSLLQITLQKAQSRPAGPPLAARNSSIVFCVRHAGLTRIASGVIPCSTRKFFRVSTCSLPGSVRES